MSEASNERKKYVLSEDGKQQCPQCLRFLRANTFIHGRNICTKCYNTNVKNAPIQEMTAKFAALEASIKAPDPEAKSRIEELEAKLQQATSKLYTIQEEYTAKTAGLEAKNAELEQRLRVFEEQNRAKAELLIERGSVIMQLQRSPQREAPHSAPLKYPDSPALSSASSSSRSSTPSTPPRLGIETLDKKLKKCPECKKVLLKATFFRRSGRRCKDCELKNPA
jgi:hypothetical protein